MSLTGLLKSDTKVGKLLRNMISMVKIDTKLISEDILNSELKAKYILRNHSLASQVGTAFDYLARFVLKHYQYKVNGECFKEYYMAKVGLNTLLNYTENKNNNYKRVYQIGLSIIDDYIKGNDSKEHFKRVVGVSVYFAKLEAIFRNGYTIDKEKALKYKIDPYVEQELYNQIEIFKTAFEEKFNIKSKPSTIYYNPMFGRCSKAVGGADADIIINDTLIDFKSSKYLNSIEEDYKQLMGYYLFSKVIEHPAKINKLCLYFSRYGKFVEYEFTKKDYFYINKARMSMEFFIDKLLKEQR